MSRKGFTLIELLVVISIIALLSSIVLTSLNTARSRSKDARRLSDVHQLQVALQVYASDNGGAFPLSTGTYCIGLNDASTCWSGYAFNGGGSGLPGSTALVSALAPYMSTLPSDPNPSRTVGDRYLYGAPNTVEAWHCTNPNPPIRGPFIVWQPEVSNPTLDSQCGPGTWACCGPLGCGNSNFCVLKI